MRSLLPLKIYLVGNWLGQRNLMEVTWREASCMLTWFGWPSFTPVVIKKRLAPLASIPSIWAQNELPGPDPNLICTLKLNSPNCNLKQSCPGQFTEQWVKKTKMHTAFKPLGFVTWHSLFQQELHDRLTYSPAMFPTDSQVHRKPRTNCYLLGEITKWLSQPWIR